MIRRFIWKLREAKRINAELEALRPLTENSPPADLEKAVRLLRELLELDYK